MLDNLRILEDVIGLTPSKSELQQALVLPVTITLITWRTFSPGNKMNLELVGMPATF